MSEWSRLLGVFFEPGKTFADIAERPRWLVPLLIGILSAVLLIYLFNRHVGWESTLQRAMDNNRFVQQLTPEQRQTAFDRQLRLLPVFSYLGAILGFPITLLLAAGLATGIIRGLLGTPIRFVQAFAVMAYAFLPRVIYQGLSITVMFLKNLAVAVYRGQPVGRVFHLGHTAHGRRIEGGGRQAAFFRRRTVRGRASVGGLRSGSWWLRRRRSGGITLPLAAPELTRTGGCGRRELVRSSAGSSIPP